jgi:hypothetical protein
MKEELLANLVAFVPPAIIVLLGVFAVKRRYGQDAPIWAYMVVFGLAAIALLFAPQIVALLN